MRRIFRFHKSNSGEIARGRLKLLLVSEQAHLSPGMLDVLRDEMAGVLSRYADFDTGQMEFQLVRAECGAAGEVLPVLAARIPLRRFTHTRKD